MTSSQSWPWLGEGCGSDGGPGNVGVDVCSCNPVLIRNHSSVVIDYVD
jgi:hypothetical protein